MSRFNHPHTPIDGPSSSVTPWHLATNSPSGAGADAGSNRHLRSFESTISESLYPLPHSDHHHAHAHAHAHEYANTQDEHRVMDGAGDCTASTPTSQNILLVILTSIVSVFHRIGFEIVFVVLLIWRLSRRYVPMAVASIGLAISASRATVTAGSEKVGYRFQGGKEVEDEADVDDSL